MVQLIFVANETMNDNNNNNNIVHCECFTLYFAIASASTIFHFSKTEENRCPNRIWKWALPKKRYRDHQEAESKISTMRRSPEDSKKETTGWLDREQWKSRSEN